MKKAHSKGSTEKAKPLSKKDVKKNPDKHIDQDFPGYPHSPSNEKMINPKTAKDKAGANLVKKENTDEQSSDGSGNAFEATENGEILREELNDDKTNY
jgi:hypothetical protein